MSSLQKVCKDKNLSIMCKPTTSESSPVAATASPLKLVRTSGPMWNVLSKVVSVVITMGVEESNNSLVHLLCIAPCF